MTEQLANEIIRNSTRCTQATLRAFGVFGYPLLGSGCLEYLTRNGFKLKRVNYGPKRMEDCIPLLTLNGQISLKGRKYLINTRNHAMALIDGILIDTEIKGYDSRKIEFIWEVTKCD